MENIQPKEGMCLKKQEIKIKDLRKLRLGRKDEKKFRKLPRNKVIQL